MTHDRWTRPAQALTSMVLLLPAAHDVLAGKVVDLTIADSRMSSGQANRPDYVFPSGLYVLPGLVDAHAHLVSSPRLGLAGYTSAARLSAADLSARVVEHLEAQLSSGVLVVRDVGGPTDLISILVHSLPEDLPRLQSAGRFIAPPGRYLAGVAVEVDDGALVDAAIAEAKRGGGWIKLIGDFPDQSSPAAWPDTAWSADHVRLAVAAAHATGARVAMHATTRPAIELALQARVDSIEHGCQMNPGHLLRMAEDGIAWTPTLAAFRAIVNASADSRPALPLELVAEGLDRAPELLRLAAELGVTLLCGTDAVIEHGAVCEEVLALIAAGLGVRRALAAATIDAWRFLRYEDPLSVGAVADLVAFDADPLQDPTTLRHPKVVLRAGRGLAVRT